ncbi:P1 family peptidase [Gordonia jinhuaensis]|uniref:L-aminopeptidase/D-esterase n=1 Tax=Gordonia jinhuaensis TaxID=1517702 RepID=A0A916X099_9ACTN|nr:P1 family peptidase [Gordonia jinhuaensis]GGB44603.1 hypothetical protein GCM10011489_35070 [Gordonia jinhuaensis]
MTLPAGTLPTGPRDLISDVAGVTVGHHHRIDEAAREATPDTPGTRETDLLDPVNSVRHADAFVLTGGSAFGLAAADGVMSHLERVGVGLPMDTAGHVVPIVPAAVIFDLPVGDWSRRPDAEFGRRAAADASEDFLLGSVGGGAAARAGALKGGFGSASVRAQTPGGASITVGAAVVVNSFGAVIRPETGLPWGADAESLAYYRLREPEESERVQLADLIARRSALNTTIGVVATDARLDVADTRRVAMAAHDGLARAVRPVHTPVDGDAFFAVATGEVVSEYPAPTGMNPDLALVAVACAAAAVAVERAVVRGVLAATPVAGIPAYAQTLPSALL